MMGSKQIGWFSLCVALLLLFATGCGSVSADIGTESSESPPLESEAESVRPLANGEQLSIQEVAAQTGTRILLDGTSVAVDGSGASASGGTVTITKSGTYHLSGRLTNGQIVIDVPGSATKVQLILDGVDITCSNSAGIYSKQAGETILTLAEGSVNTVRDGAIYSYPNANTDEPDAAIFCKDDLRIGGTGTLEVTGSFNNGIGTKDDLVIESGNIKVAAPNHGIRGRDSLSILGGSFVIDTGNDGIQSNNDEDTGKGWVSLQGGTYRITSAHDGIQAENRLSITGGDFTIRSGGGHTVTAASSEDSYKGLKAGVNLEISGGKMSVDSLDDALHSNGNIEISGGSLELASGDDGIHADNTVSISGGDINITASFEGIEGAVVKVSDGTVHLVASDDGINAAGGTDGGEGGRFGRDAFASNDDYYMEFSGGWITVNASGDGLDSNGNIFMNGGTILVNGPTGDWNAPLDFNGRFEQTGGVLAAAGSAGMAQAPESGSGQPSLMVYFSQVQAAGTTFHLADASGSPVLSYTPSKNFTSIVVSSPVLTRGQRYAVYTGGSNTAENRDGLALGGSLTGGMRLFEVTLPEGSTSVDETGSPVTSRWGNRPGRW